MRYINDVDFQVIYINNEINIVNYEKINYMENEKVSLSHKNGTVVIKGTNLRVKKLLDNEIVIVGSFENVEFRKWLWVIMILK